MDVPPPPQVPGEPGHIPADYIPKPKNCIARASDAAEVPRLADKIADRFGPSPEPVETLGIGPEGDALCFRKGVRMKDGRPLVLGL